MLDSRNRQASRVWRLPNLDIDAGRIPFTEIENHRLADKPAVVRRAGTDQERVSARQHAHQTKLSIRLRPLPVSAISACEHAFLSHATDSNLNAGYQLSCVGGHD